MTARTLSTAPAPAAAPAGAPRARRAGIAALALAAGAGLAIAGPTAAFAHVSASSDSTAPGGRALVTFSMSHGCEGSSTTVVTIDIPESIPTVAPTVYAGWSVEKVMVPLDAPIETEYDTLTERVGQIVYTATDAPLADGYRAAFDLQVTLPEGEPGERIEFPTTQTCEVGTAAWTGEDAPVVTLTDGAAEDDHDSADAGGHSEADDSATLTSATREASGGGDDLIVRILGALGLVAGTAALTLALVRRRGASS
ncbi:YcnI family protein [Yonghaparkia sp. Soil809]|uniref:YcnI family copper-binding membrane protein n=1 Tax=Yonghaparkia sp. Soil809 TaxID=1736417 RepID=UPI0006FF4C5B|nr:YcnI family protein [Yonghaparkia sp. Soil809]KRF30988.1 hypothetical protein ASG83_09140 [Yonghaparkia sp. Soil809]